MNRFPKVDSPCPLKEDRQAKFIGDYCTQCDRKVHDLTTMTSARREEFLKGCDQEICVSYSLSTQIPKRTTLHAALLTAAITASAGIAPAVGAQEPFCDLPEMVIVGGVKAPSSANWIDVEDEKDLPELPIIVETSTDGKVTS